MTNRFDVMKNEILTHVDVNDVDDEILLTCDSGKQFKLYHDQNCCENVYIRGTDGDWKQLIGKRLVAVTEDGDSGFDDEHESWTTTNIRFETDDATVVSKWFGSSNGYYSEEVDLKIIEGK